MGGWIPDSLSWILDLKAQDSSFRSKAFQIFRNKDYLIWGVSMYSCHDVFIGSHQLRAPGFTFLSFNLFTVEARCVFFFFFFTVCNTRFHVPMFSLSLIIWKGCLRKVRYDFFSSRLMMILQNKIGILYSWSIFWHFQWWHERVKIKLFLSQKRIKKMVPGLCL